MRVPVTAALLALPCLASALTLTKVATPKVGSSAIEIADAERLIDGTWAVCSEDGSCLQSADKGASWTAISALSGDTAEIAGKALVSRNGTQVWTRAKGWHAMKLPTSFSTGTYSYNYVGSEGVRARQVGSTMTWYRADSTWENWTEWFSMQVSGQFDEELAQSGYTALGKVWFPIADSGYLRGTADGKTWSRMTAPDFEPLMLTSERSPGVVAGIGLTATYSLRGGWSADTGKTWTQGDGSLPGQILMLSEMGYEMSVTVSGMQMSEFWLSRSRTGGWESIGDVKGFFFEAGVPHVVKADGIYRVDGMASGISRGGKGPSNLLRLERGAVTAVLLDASLLGKEWQLVGADGAVRARGTTSSLRQELPALRGTGWFKVGPESLAIPAL